MSVKRKVPGHIQPPSMKKLLSDWDAAQWSIACREMQIRIAHGSMEAAHAILDRFIHTTRPRLATLESHVSTVFDAKLAGMLEANGYCTVRVLDRVGDDRLVVIPGLGGVHLRTIRRRISEIKRRECLELTPEDGYDALIDEEHGYKPRTLPENPGDAQERNQRFVQSV